MNPIPDQRLTDYALGEVTDADERERIEAHLESDEAARAHVREVEAAAARLERALAAEVEAGDGLTASQRERIESRLRAAPGGAAKRRGGGRRFTLWMAGTAIAASLALLAGFLVLPELGAARRTARQMQYAYEQKASVPERGFDEDAQGGRQARGASEEDASDPAARARRRSDPGDASRAQGRLTQKAGSEEASPAASPAAEPERKVMAMREKVYEAKVGAEYQQMEDMEEAEMARAATSAERVENLMEGRNSVRQPTEQEGIQAGSGEGSGAFQTESYDRITDNPFRRTGEHPLSTFSVDVDTASYANVRRFLTQMKRLPPPDAVRIEELVNYFDYDDPAPGPAHEHPFALSAEVTDCPWQPSHRLARIAIQGRELTAEARKPTNLVFLLDVSGSMRAANKLAMVKKSLRLLARQMRPEDRVAIVVYAGAAGRPLDATSDPEAVVAALSKLRAGGSTHGSAGIELAYETAEANFIEDGVNRVILCTDGDFNVGVTDRGRLTRMIEAKAERGVALTVLGFGMGNYKDATMEELTNAGDGNYAYIDTLDEARKVLVEELAGTIETIAKDVKIQVEFNPAAVAAYRLIGYENRILDKEDFNDDTVDAGDIGAGHHVTALYQIVPAGTPIEPGFDPGAARARIEALEANIERIEAFLAEGGVEAEAARKLRAQLAAEKREVAELEGRLAGRPEVDALKYQSEPELTPEAERGELMTLKFRYKQPDAPKVQGTSTLIERPVPDRVRAFEEADPDTRFAAAVAAFGMMLRKSPYRGEATWEGILSVAEAAAGERDPEAAPMGGGPDRRRAFLELVRAARELAGE